MFYGDVTVNVFHRDQIGYTIKAEQARPRTLVEDVVAAEAAGSAFSVTASQGVRALRLAGPGSRRAGHVEDPGDDVRHLSDHARYHPRVIARKAATLHTLASRAVNAHDRSGDPHVSPPLTGYEIFAGPLVRAIARVADTEPWGEPGVSPRTAGGTRWEHATRSAAGPCTGS